jgi:hypothetical protein
VTLSAGYGFQFDKRAEDSRGFRPAAARGLQRFQRMTPILKSGVLAAATTTGTLLALGWLRERRAAAPLNAVSHIVYGDEAALRDEPSAKYTLTGIVLNAAAVTGWAAVQSLLFARRRAKTRRPLLRALVRGATTSALAYAVDYGASPKRLTPGFEKRLSRGGLAVLYGVLALSLAAGSLAHSTGERAISTPASLS